MSGLIPIVARAASTGVVKKIAQRVVGGITGAGAKQVAPVYRNMETGSVKVTKPMGERNAKLFNEYKTDEAGFIKSGQLARDVRNLRDWENSVGNVKKPTIKINSNPKRGN
jgi:hypothetical protein